MILIQMFQGDGDMAKVVCIEHQDSFRSGPIRAPCEQLHDKKRLQIPLKRLGAMGRFQDRQINDRVGELNIYIYIIYTIIIYIYIYVYKYRERDSKTHTSVNICVVEYIQKDAAQFLHSDNESIALVQLPFFLAAGLTALVCQGIVI